MSTDDLVSGFVRAFGGKNKSEERVGLDYLNDTMSFRTKRLGDGGLLRTKGGHPQVIYEPNNEAAYIIPAYKHGLIKDNKLYLYNDTTNIPTGDVFTLESPVDGWGARSDNNRWRFGHTHFISGLQLNQNSTEFAPSVATAGSGGSSLMFGVDQMFTIKSLNFTIGGNGVHKWLYQAPSGDKHIMSLTYTVPNMGTTGYSKTSGSAWTVTTELTAQKILGDGSLDSVVTVFTGQTFDVNNYTPYTYEWDNYVRGGTGYTPEVYEGLNPSPTGDEAILNWLVKRNASNIERFCMKSMRLTITESGATLSAAWALDMGEHDCFEITAARDTSTSTPTTGVIPRVTFIPGVGDLYDWAVVSPDGDYESEGIRHYFRQNTWLTMRGFEPKSGENVVTDLWRRETWVQEGVSTQSQTYSGSIQQSYVDGNPVYTGSMQRVTSGYTTTADYTTVEILKDADVVAEYRYEASRMGDTLDAEYWTGGSTLSTQYHYKMPGATNEWLAVVNGARSSLQRWDQDWIDVVTTTQGMPGADGTYSGPYRQASSFEYATYMQTNNCVVLAIQVGWRSADWPWGTTPPDSTANVYKYYIGVGLGKNGDNPAVKDFGAQLDYLQEVPSGLDYRFYTYRVSWNPRRPSLWAIAGTENNPNYPFAIVDYVDVAWI